MFHDQPEFSEKLDDDQDKPSENFEDELFDVHTIITVTVRDLGNPLQNLLPIIPEVPLQLNFKMVAPVCGSRQLNQLFREKFVCASNLAPMPVQ